MAEIYFSAILRFQKFFKNTSSCVLWWKSFRLWFDSGLHWCTIIPLWETGLQASTVLLNTKQKKAREEMVDRVDGGIWSGFDILAYIKLFNVIFTDMIFDKPIIYLDNNATTRIDPRVLEAMMPFLTDNFANAASTHHFGIGAHDAVKNARKQVADLIGADTHEIIFTSGATEAINLAIKGVAENYQDKGKHIITVQTEHSAVLDTCRSLEQKGFEVTYLPVKNDGLIELDELQKALRPDTILVSVMFANNETGVIQPIKAIAEIVHEAGAFFMSDGTQAVGKIPLNVREYGIDLLCMSAHKIHGPKGVGALYIKQKGEGKVKLHALFHGGGHERGLRSGTLNVPGIVGLGKACAIARSEMKKDSERIEKLRNYLEEQLLKIEDTSVNGITTSRMLNVSNICFKNADSDAIIIGLSNPESELPLIAVSNGSACTSTSNEPSHVLIAMGLNERDAYSCIRFSLGRFSTMSEMQGTIDCLNKIISSLRKMTT